MGHVCRFRALLQVLSAPAPLQLSSELSPRLSLPSPCLDIQTQQKRTPSMNFEAPTALLICDEALGVQHVLVGFLQMRKKA